MNRVEKMIAHMQRFGASRSKTLAAVCGLPDSGRVSALLKSRIQKGQVEKIDDRWRLNPDYNEWQNSDLRDARILLERAGYRVLPPQRERA